MICLVKKDEFKTVFLVRHGQSLDNTQPIFQSIHSPLSEHGHMQAKAIAERLRHVEFDALISSPLQRAKQTAEHIAEATGKTAELSDLFVERKKPDAVDGKPYADPEAANAWKTWHLALYETGPAKGDSEHTDGGETYDQLITRTDSALKYLLDRPESSIVVVTHGYFLRTILARVLTGKELNGTLLRRFQEHAGVANTGVTVLRYKDAFEEDFAWRLWTYNDHTHFAE